MATETVVRYIKIVGQEEGIEKLAGSLNKLAGAQENVAVVSETSAKRQISMEQVVGRLERTYVAGVRQAQEFEKVQRQVNAAVAQNPQLQERANVILQQAAARLNTVGKSTEQVANQSKLARYELINLSRQFQDVGVSLASGQSPLTVLVQQGSQIADVFASSQASVGSFFTQAAGWAGRFIGSVAGVATTTVSVGAAALYAASSWSSGQRDIERSLAGVGRASGVTRDQINQIAQSASSSTALSIGEAREAATAFAATGRIYGANIQAASDLTKDFARATGTDAATAVKSLTAALLEPVSGAQELNKTLGFLDGQTLQLIRTLESQNKHQEAQKVLMDAARPSIKAVADQASDLAKAWDTTTAAVAKYWDMYKQATARSAERLTGANLGGFSDDEQLKNITAARDRLQNSVAGRFGLNDSAIADYNKILDQLAAKMRAAAEASADKRFNQFSLEADNAVRAVIPEIEQIEKLTARLADLKRATEGVTGIAAGYAGEAAVNPKDVSSRQGLGGDNRAAIQAAELQLRLTQETKAETERHNAAVMQIAGSYSGVSVQTAMILRDLQNQLPVAQAIGAAARLRAQEQATLNDLMDKGRTLEEASAIAADQRRNTQAQITSQSQEATFSLQNQLPVAQAVGGAAKMAAQEQATYNQLIHDAVPPAQALAQANAQRANTQAQVNSGAMENLANMQGQLAVAEAFGGKAKMAAQEQATLNNLLRQGVDAELAAAMAATERAITQAKLNNQAEETTFSLKNQLGVMGAITGAERIRAQEAATYNQLVHNGVDEMEAAAQAAAQRANSEAAVNAQIGQQIFGIKQQIELIQASVNGTEAEVRAQQAYTNAIRAGAGQMEAMALKAATLALEMEKVAAATAKAQAALEATESFSGWNTWAGQPSESKKFSLGNFDLKNFISTTTNNPYSNLINQQANLMRWQMNQGLQRERNLSQAKEAESLWSNPQQGYAKVAEEAFAKSGSLQEAINAINNFAGDYKFGGTGSFGTGFKVNQKDPGVIVGRETELAELYKRMTEQTGSSAQEQGFITKAIGELRGVHSFAASDLIKTLNDRLAELTKSAEGLTGSTDQLNSTMQVGLSDYYQQQGPGTHLGFRGTQVAASDNPLSDMFVLPGGSAVPSDIRVPGAGPAGAPVVAPAPAAQPPQPPYGGQGPNPGWGQPWPQVAPVGPTNWGKNLYPGGGYGNPTTGTVVDPRGPGGAGFDPQNGFVNFAGATGGDGSIIGPDGRRYFAMGAGAASLPGFATGGSFIVPGGQSAVDNKVAQFRVSSGERVDIRTPEQVANDNRDQSSTFEQHVHVSGSVTKSTLNDLRISAFQASQMMQRGRRR